MKPLYLIIFLAILLWPPRVQAAHGPDGKPKTAKFVLYYNEFDMIPFLGYKEYPSVKIEDNTLSYTYLQLNGKYELDRWGKNDEYIDTVWLKDTITQSVYFRQGSIDSITALAIASGKDSIFDWNPDIIDGGGYDLTIEYGPGKSLNIFMQNTYDSIAYKTINIIQPYLPQNNKALKIYIPFDLWEGEKAAWERMGKQ